MNGDFDFGSILILGILFWAWYASAKEAKANQRGATRITVKGA